jgi:trimethylamine--corrinoid protein Co-methyltransferase|tara:strand:+ start:2916 stop:4448 length:1533 start_codon:yes stop_codon:yes gene_type:complete
MTENKRNERRRKRSSAKPSNTRTPDYRQLKHPFEPQRIFSADEINNLHQTALRVLEELGIKVLLPEARKMFAAAGALVCDDMVFIGRDIVAAALQTAPPKIRLRAANPIREQDYEEGAMLFSPGSGCPNVTDFEGGRRPGSLKDHEDTIKLAQSFDVIHQLGQSAEPQDVPIQFRHYDMVRAALEFSDKPLHLFARGRGQATESFEMIQLALNLSDDEFADGAWATTIINTNSPRILDNPMAQGIIDFARAGQMVVITPFCLAGAMAPITIAGALTLQHAESLMGITLAQLSKAGAPVSYGGFNSNVDMKSGAPAFGTPEHVKMQIGGGQLARHIGLPWRSATGTASNTSDMQAATETSMALWGTMMANATLTLHAAGWLEGGLTFGYEKFINDIEALQTVAELAVRPTVADAEIGFDAIAEVEPGGHFFSISHTMERYSTEFYQPVIADLRNIGAWTEAGGLTSAERATGIWKRILAEFEKPSTGDAAAERLKPYIEKKTKAGGAAPVE